MKNSTLHISILVLVSVLAADSSDVFTTFSKEQKIEQAQYWQTDKNEFYRYAFDMQNGQAQTREAFESWYKKQKLAIAAFEDSIRLIWGHYNKPLPSKWVEYSKDGYSVAQVDFKEKMVTVEATGRSNETGEELRKKLKDAISRIVTSKGFATLAPVAGEDSNHTVMKSPILFPVMTDSAGNPLISELQIERFAADKAKNVDSSGNVVNGKVKKVFRVQFAIATKSDYHMMKPYLPIVKIYAKRYNLDVSLILATIHAESNFNPMARSGANAIGLMQLVPDRGALDAYKYLYGKERVPTVSMLMDPKTNIHLGCVYMYLLQRYHFGNIKDPLSTTYCSIAGYNTGPGNVAKAFSGNYHLPKAIATINGMGNSQSVFNHLVGNLPYEETRTYLQKVVSFMPFYKPEQLSEWQKSL